MTQGPKEARMSRFLKIWPLLAFMVFMAGCQPVDSLNPLYTDKDVIFDPALLGKWTEEGGTMEFIEDPDDQYERRYRDYMMIFRDDETSHQTEFKARLINLQGHRFLDVEQLLPMVFEESYYLDVKQTKQGPRFSTQFVHAGDGTYLEFANDDTGHTGEFTLRVRVAHWFFRITSDDNGLRLDPIDDDHLETLLEEKKAQITHIMARNSYKDSHELLLTAETAELQRFVVEHVNDDNFFSGGRNLIKAK